MRLRDSSKVLANLRDRTFDEQVKKHTAIWNAPKPADGLVAAAGPPVALPGAQPPGTVAPRYDFPSSDHGSRISLRSSRATRRGLNRPIPTLRSPPGRRDRSPRPSPAKFACAAARSADERSDIRER
jgi:hypothetical protein